MRVVRFVFLAVLALTASTLAQSQLSNNAKPVPHVLPSTHLALAPAIAEDASPAPLAAHSPDTLQTKRVHLLLAADTADGGIGEGVGIDATNMEEVFKELVPGPGQLVVRKILGEELTQENVFRRIAEVRPSPGDAMVFVFSGHGGSNDDGHFFCMAKGIQVYRADVVAAMRKTGVRLAVLLSNGCNVHSDTSIAHFTGDVSSAVGEPFWAMAHVVPLGDSLLLEPYGVLDINGASEGQVTCASPPRGSTSLRPLVDLLRENRDKRLSWQEIVADLDPRIEKEFKIRYPKGGGCEPHKVKVWSLPRTDDGPRFGAAVAENNGEGVRVVEAWPYYPATRMRAAKTGQLLRLESGDVVLTANGVKIRCMEHFYNVVMSAPEKMDLSVRDARTGEVTDMTATLGDGHRAGYEGAGAAGPEAEYVFDLAGIQALRARAEKARALLGPSAEGWSKSPVDPADVLKLFKPLRLKSGLALCGDVFNETTIGVGKVWAVPTGAVLLGSDHSGLPSKPAGALNSVMEGITGDGSAWSYLCASILSRELAEFGARWHRCDWTTHTLLGADPLTVGSARRDASSNDATDGYAKGQLPAVGESGWKWLAPLPGQWRPSVSVTCDSVTVVFYTYSPLGQEGIYRHVDRYSPGSYVASPQTVKIAEGRRYMVF